LVVPDGGVSDPAIVAPELGDEEAEPPANGADALLDAD
jgi:hypothetical protein